jgi:hypothetical protein
MECDIREVGKIDMRQFSECLSNLQQYSLLRHENDIVKLGCDLVELKTELDALT